MTVLHSTIRGQGADIYLLHGWGLNSGVWEHLQSLLQREYRVHCIDLPGFGQSHNVMPERYTLSAVSELVAQKIQKPGVVVGWSLGGLIAQQLALSLPDRVTHLVGVATSPCFMACGDWPGIDPKVLEGFRHQLHTDTAATINRFLSIQAMGSSSTKADIAKIKQAVSDFPEPNAIALEGGLEILRDSDLRKQLSDIQCPTLRIYGRRDSLVPVRVLEEVERWQPASSAILFPSASHAPFISHQSEFAETLQTYLHEQLHS